jgi:hypothetical protein
MSPARLGPLGRHPVPAATAELATAVAGLQHRIGGAGDGGRGGGVVRRTRLSRVRRRTAAGRGRGRLWRETRRPRGFWAGGCDKSYLGFVCGISGSFVGFQALVQINFSLAHRLEPNILRPAVDRAIGLALELTRVTKGPSRFEALASSITSLGPHLNPALTGRICGRLINVIESTSDPQALQALEAAMSFVACRIDSPTAVQIFQHTMQCWQRSSDSDQLEVLARVFATLSARFDIEGLDPIVARIIAFSGKNGSPRALLGLAHSLARLARRSGDAILREQANKTNYLSGTLRQPRHARCRDRWSAGS